MTTEPKLLTEAEVRDLLERYTEDGVIDELRERGLIAEGPVDAFAILNRSGGKGPHLDKTNATFPQLAQWADEAAGNIENGWKNVDAFSGHMGGWEQTLLRHLAKELRLAHRSLAALKRGMELAPRKELTREMVREALRARLGMVVSWDEANAIAADLTEALQ